MSFKTIQTSSVSCNCFSNQYQIQSNTGFINNNNNHKPTHNISTNWQQKLLTKIATYQSIQNQQQHSILQKIKKKSLKRQINLPTQKKYQQLQSPLRPELTGYDKKLQIRQSLEAIRQIEISKKQKIMCNPNNNQVHPISYHILSLSKHQSHPAPNYKNYQYSNHLEDSNHNKHNDFPINFNHKPCQKHTQKIINIPKQQSLLFGINNPTKKQVIEQQHMLLFKQHQENKNTLHPNSAHRTPRKFSIKQQMIEITNLKNPKTIRLSKQSQRPTILQIKTMSNGSPDPKASKKYSLIQSTANKTLMKPKQIESVLDSDQNEDDRFSEVVMDMNRVEEISQIQKVSTHEALKTAFMMKGTMMGTNATQSCVQNHRSSQFQ